MKDRTAAARQLVLSFPRRACVGPGCVKHLGQEARRLGRRALLVTGRRALREAGTTERLVDLLTGAGVEVETFEEVPPEPDLDAVDGARERLRSAGCEMVIEAGGGSALDVGKAAAALAAAPEPTAVYHAGAPIPPGGLAHIAIPTTAGTGAEATRNSVLTDHGAGVKKSIRADSLLPDACIVDAELTLSCSPEVTAASGMDALCQAMESYTSVHAVPATMALSLEAVRMIARSLPAAFERGGDLTARAEMAQASFMAGIALGNARLGAVHGLAHPLGLLYEMSHGAVCAVLLPHVLERNAPAMDDAYARLGEAMGGDPIEAVDSLLERLRLPRTLGPYPDASAERTVMSYALSSGSSRANPLTVDEAYVRGVLRAVCT